MSLLIRILNILKIEESVEVALFRNIFSKTAILPDVTLTHMCLHAGLQYNGIDCNGGYVEWLRLVVYLSVSASVRASAGVSVGFPSASGRVSVSTSDRPSVRCLSRHLLECLLWQLSGCLSRHPLAHLLVHL